jgi:hypothetical protein
VTGHRYCVIEQEIYRHRWFRLKTRRLDSRAVHNSAGPAGAIAAEAVSRKAEKQRSWDQSRRLGAPADAVHLSLIIAGGG